MILTRPDSGCPDFTDEVTYIDQNTFEDLSFCLCEDYCSWKGCNLEAPPLNCLLENKSTWLWDARKQIWIAGLVDGMKKRIYSILNFIAKI